jgi:ATP synthase protein I
METERKDQNPLKKPLNSYAKYSVMGIQMAAIIFIGTFAGIKLDNLLKWKFPVFTILFALASVVLAIYFVVKDLIKK